MQIKHDISELAEWSQNGYNFFLLKYELDKEKEGWTGRLQILDEIKNHGIENKI